MKPKTRKSQPDELAIPDGIRTLAIDIETRPALAYIWSLWDQCVPLDRLIDASEMISFAAKWVGQKKIEFRSVHHHSRAAMVSYAWHLLNEADIVLHYNGKRFDVPYLNREFLAHGLTPPAPYKQVDLLETCKRQFRFQSNKLAFVSKELGFAGKVEHEGFPLWVKCMNDDPTAWARMRKYNIQDVKLLEDVYFKLRPWIIRHPSIAAMKGEDSCPVCGSVDLEHRGHVALSTGRYRRWVCKECGKWSRSTRRMDSVRITEVAL